MDDDLTRRPDGRPAPDVLEHAGRVLGAIRALTAGTPDRRARTAEDAASFAADLMVDAAALLRGYSNTADVDPGDVLALAWRRADDPARDPRWDVAERLTRATERIFTGAFRDVRPATAAPAQPDGGSFDPAAVRAAAERLHAGPDYVLADQLDSLGLHATADRERSRPVVPDPPAGEALPVDPAER